MSRSHAAGQLSPHPSPTLIPQKSRKNTSHSQNSVSSVSSTSTPHRPSGKTRSSQTGASSTPSPTSAASGGPASPATSALFSGKTLSAILSPSAKVSLLHTIPTAVLTLPDHLRSCLVRAKRALSANLFPQSTLDLIDQDVCSTLPSLHLFHPHSGPLHNDLKDMLYAWVIARSDQGLGYTSGAAKIAAMLLITMPIHQAFNVMRNLLERHCLRTFYGGDTSKNDVRPLPITCRPLSHPFPARGLLQVSRTLTPPNSPAHHQQDIRRPPSRRHAKKYPSPLLPLLPISLSQSISTLNSTTYHQLPTSPTGLPPSFSIISPLRPAPEYGMSSCSRVILFSIASHSLSSAS